MALLNLKGSQNTFVILLGSFEVTYYTIAQRSEVSKVDEVSQCTVLNIYSLEQVDSDRKVINRILRTTSFKLTNTITVICISQGRLDYHSDFVPFASCIIPLL